MELPPGTTPKEAQEALVEINQGKCPLNLEPVVLSNRWSIHLLPKTLLYVVVDPEKEPRGVHDEFSDAFVQAFCEERS